MTIYITLLGMLGLFFLWLLVKEVLYKLTKKKICVICATVISTWLILLILKLVGYNIPLLIVAILMGQSIAGLMYTLEKKFKKGGGKLLILKPLIILGGTLLAYLLLEFIYV